MLKAVAIEHSKDVNGAAEVIVSEVLPFLLQQSTVDHPLPKECSPSGLSVGRGKTEADINPFDTIC